MKSKKCSGKCGEVKLLSEFYKQKTNKDGFQYACKVCRIKQIKSLDRTLEGKLKAIYRDMGKSQRERTKNNGTLHSVVFSKDEFVAKNIVHHDYIRLHEQWVASDYNMMLAPSFDRIDDYGNYSWDNFNRWMTFKENTDKGHRDQLNGVNTKNSKAVRGVNIKTGDIVEFFSQHEAGRNLGIQQANLSACCLGKIGSAGGYIWSFSDMNGDRQNERKIDL